MIASNFLTNKAKAYDSISYSGKLSHKGSQGAGCVTPITVRGLTIGYGSKAVLKDADFEVRTGEVLAIIGPNGAGKSTLLKTLAAQLPLLGGQISLMGSDIRKLRPEDIARSLSLFLTDSPSTEWMTCRELVSAGRYPYTGRLGLLSEADWSIVDASMEKMGAADLSDIPFFNIKEEFWPMFVVWFKGLVKLAAWMTVLITLLNIIQRAFYEYGIMTYISSGISILSVLTSAFYYYILSQRYLK